MSNNTDAILRACCAESCQLSTLLSHYVMVLAQLANWKTGRGIAGQGRIARAMRIDPRTTRRLKTQLAAAVADGTSPVSVTWAHRSRPDGMNGSDSYVIRLVDTGSVCADTGSSGGGQRIVAPTNITTGSPQETPQLLQKENENLFLGDRPLASPKLTPRLLPPEWRPNATHLKSANRLGVDFEEALGGFRGYWQGRVGSERTPLEWDRTFGGWLKRQRPRPAAPAADEWEWVEVKAEEAPVT